MFDVPGSLIREQGEDAIVAQAPRIRRVVSVVDERARVAIELTEPAAGRDPQIAEAILAGQAQLEGDDASDEAIAAAMADAGAEMAGEEAAQE